MNFSIKSQYSAFFDSIAKANYHLPLAIDLGGYVESAPTINAQSFGGSGQISGNFTQSQANELTRRPQVRPDPGFSLNTATYTTVSPTLGKASLQAGLLAGLLGLLLVMGYTIFYYRALGVVVVLGLVTTGALIYAIISLLGATSAGLTLDLSGMTGLIVSVGITVDSYVVYFERLKDEELHAGRSVRSSVDRGFKSAYRTDPFGGRRLLPRRARSLDPVYRRRCEASPSCSGCRRSSTSSPPTPSARPLVILLGRNPPLHRGGRISASAGPRRTVGGGTVTTATLELGGQPGLGHAPA